MARHCVISEYSGVTRRTAALTTIEDAFLLYVVAANNRCTRLSNPKRKNRGSTAMMHQTQLMLKIQASKIGTQTGSNIYGLRIKEAIPIGKWPTVFQAKLYAIYVCVWVSNKYIDTLNEVSSWTAGSILIRKKCEFNLVWSYNVLPRHLAIRNLDQLYRLLGYWEIEGN